LLRRLAETGGGRILDPENLADNAFLHDRQKTFQPRDLWEWFLKMAVLLFPLDVGVRRIQLDRDEVRRAWQKLRRRLFFWAATPREPEAEESLAALLAGANRCVPPKRARPAEPELFRPEKSVTLPLETESEVETARPAAGETSPAPEAKPADAPPSTTSRLLDAKRRAQRRKE